MAEPRPAPTEDSLFEMALYVYQYARRWAVGQSSDPADAVIYDACIAVINEHYAPRRLGSHQRSSAASDRYIRYGAEPMQAPFRIPITVEDAVVILHRFARRWTNGRGSFTAALVNTTANDLLAKGISLDETRTLDGTVWAADGTNGEHDGLTDEQRTEALSVLPSTLGRDTATG